MKQRLENDLQIYHQC